MIKLLNLFIIDMKIALLNQKRYFLSWFSVLLSFILGFFALIKVSEGFTNEKNLLLSFEENATLGYVIWYFCTNAIRGMSQSIEGNASIGVIENVFLSPLNGLTNLIIGSICSFLIDLVSSIFMLFFLSIIINIKINFHLGLIPLVILTYIGVYGLGLIFGGITFIYKKIEGIISIIHIFFLVFMIIQSTNIINSKIFYIIPLISGLMIIKNFFLNNYSFLKLFFLSETYIFLISTIIYIIIGILFFNKCEKLSRKKGILGLY